MHDNVVVLIAHNTQHTTAVVVHQQVLENTEYGAYQYLFLPKTDVATGHIPTEHILTVSTHHIKAAQTLYPRALIVATPPYTVPPSPTAMLVGVSQPFTLLFHSVK